MHLGAETVVLLLLLTLFVWFDHPGESSPEKDCFW